MALTRKDIRTWLEDENMDMEAKIQKIIGGHLETVDGLRDEATRFKADAERLASVQTELDELKAKGDYKEQYETEKAAHEALIAKLESEKTATAKEKAVRAYYESKNIKGNNLNIAMRGTKLDAIELDGESIKDTAGLDELVAGDFASLVTKPRKVVDSGGGLGGGSHSDDDKVLSLADALRAQYDI